MRVLFFSFVTGLLLTDEQQELYEALWEDLLAQSRRNGFRIKAIWIADCAWQGYSGELNEEHLGNDREFSLFRVSLS